MNHAPVMITGSYGHRTTIVFEITGSPGRDISNAAYLARIAEEVVFLPGTKFKVAKIVPATRNKPYRIVFEEVP